MTIAQCLCKSLTVIITILETMWNCNCVTKIRTIKTWQRQGVFVNLGQLLHRCGIWTGRASTSLCCRRKRRTAPTRSSTMATRSWRQAELYRCAFLELSLELSWVENNPGESWIENHAKDSFFEIGFCCWNLPMCLSQRQLEGHAFSFLPTTNWTYIQNKSAGCPFTIL